MGGYYMPYYDPASQYDPYGGGEQISQPTYAQPAQPTGVPRYTYNPGQTTANYYTPQVTGDPNKMLRDQRLGSYATQQGFEQQLAPWQAQMQGMSTDYANLAGQLYSPIWQGGGGYTPEMLAEIQQREALGGLQPTQADLDAGMLQGYETQGIEGSPYAAFNAFDPTQAQNIFSDYQGQTRNKFFEGRDALRAGVGQMQDAYGNVIGGMEKGYDEAIDPATLRMSSAYPSAQEQALQTGASGIRGAYSGNPALSLSSEYLRQAPMSDTEVDQMAGAQAADVGAGYRGAIDQLESNARASGAASPMAVAAARENLERLSAADSGDALTRGRLAARAAQRTAAQNVEDTRLGAGRYQSGLQLSGESGLMGAALGAAGQREQTRLGAEQDLAGRRMAATQALGQAGMSAAGNVGQLGTGVESGIMGAGIGMESDLGQRATGLEQWSMGNRTGLLSQAEQQEAQRRAATAQTNLAGRQRASDISYQRPYQLATTQSGLAQASYAPWLSAQQEGRQAAVGQQQWAGNQANQTMNQRLQNWQQGQQGQQAAINTYTQNKQYEGSKPGVLSRLAGALKGATAGYATGGLGGAIGGGFTGAYGG